jgi:hypothetical protein
MPTTYPRIIYQPAAGEEQVFVPETTTPPPDPEPTDDACLVITLDGADHTFRPDDGQELDSYVDPAGAFEQRSILIEHPELADFVVFYRPDANGEREEWVIECGDMWATTTVNPGPYTATITARDGTAHSVQLTSHSWFARWRWQSEPRPVRANYDLLAHDGKLPYLGAAGVPVGPLLTVSDYSPMALCGLPANQGTTGAYPGIGPITGWQAQYLERGAPETSFRNHLEASGSYQWHIRDSIAPIDAVSNHPRASLYGDKGNPDIAKPSGPTTPDTGHLPSISYVAFLLTGDPYALEEMQFSANYMILMNPPDSQLYVAGRYLAWPTRAFGEVCLAMDPAHDYPSWLLTRGYFEYWLDYCRSQIESRARDLTDPYFYLFRTVPEWGQTTDLDPSKTGDHVWQQGMLCWVACWLARSRDEWVESAEWLLGGQIARSSTTSGWATSHPAPYHLRMRCASVLAHELSANAGTLTLLYQDTFTAGEVVLIDSEQIRLDRSEDYLTWEVTRAQAGTVAAVHPVKRVVYGRKFTSWCEAAASNALVYGWTDADEEAPPDGFDPTYLSYMMSALAEGLQAGLDVPGLKESHDWVHGLIDGQTRTVYDNWCVAAPDHQTRAMRSKPHWATDSRYHPELDDLRTGEDDDDS